MSWKKVKLGTILTESKVVSEFPDTNKRIKVRLKVLGVEKRGVENEVEGATKQFVRKTGQFIYGKQNFHKGAFGIVPKELDGFESSSDLPAFDVDKSCLPEFLFYFFKQGNYYLELSKIASGVATQRINTSQLFDLEIPLPDIEIQKTLLKNIKILENNGSEISSELTHQLNLIKQLRQAFLREAMQGKLVTAVTLSGVETQQTGQQLLTIIKAEKKLIADKKLKKEKELPPIAEKDIPFEIPKHWAWCRLGEVIYDTDSGKSPNCVNQPVNEIQWGVIKTTAVQEMFFLENENKILPEKFIVNQQHKIYEGDILITRAGPKNRVGVVCCVEKLTKNLILSDKTIRIKFSKKLLSPKYFTIALNSPLIKKLIEKKMTGMADSQVNITQDNIKGFTIPIPPLHEQEQIVTKLEELMAFCEDLEKSIKGSQRYNEMLLQQVLREALQGKEAVK